MQRSVILLQLLFAWLAITCQAAKGGLDPIDQAESDEYNSLSGSGMDEDGYGGGYGDGYGGGYGRGGYGGGGYGDYGDGSPKPSQQAVNLESVDEVKSFIADNQDKSLVIGFFDLTSNSADKAVFDEIAEKDQYHYKMAYTTSKEVLEEFRYDGCAVIVYPPAKFISDKVEKAKARYPGKSLKAESLKKFIYDKSLPLVGLRSFEGEERYRKPGLPIVTVFADVDLDKNFKTFQYVANRVRKVAVDHKGKVLFNIANKKEFNYLLDDYGLKSLDKNDIGMGLVFGNTFYHSKNAFSVDTLREFVKQFLNGEIVGIEKDISSPPPGSTQDDEEPSGPSAVIAGTDKNFKQEVMDSTADAMIEFYAPWCGHCKSLKPKYEQLAKHFEDDDGVKIVAFDATASDVPKGFDVEGYPTLFFLPASTKKPVPYDGARETDSMISFIKKHRTTSK